MNISPGPQLCICSGILWSTIHSGRSPPGVISQRVNEINSEFPTQLNSISLPGHMSPLGGDNWDNTPAEHVRKHTTEMSIILDGMLKFVLDGIYLK